MKQHHNEVNELRAERLARTTNPFALVAQQQPVYHPQNHHNHYTQNSSTRLQQATTRNRGKEIVNSSPPTYDQEPTMVAEDDEMSKEKEIDKLMDLISLSFKKIYKPTNNNLKTSSNTSRAHQDNTPRINKGAGYDNQRQGNVRNRNGKRMQLITRRKCYCELEAHSLYMAHIQEVTSDAADNSGPIIDVEPLQKVQNDNDNYNVFANDREHPEQPESVNDTYLVEHGDTNITIDSLDMSTNGETVHQDDDDDLAKERDLLASLIEKLKCEIDDNKNRNKFLESSNKTLIDKLKGEVEDFKIKNKSLESSNNHFKEANNELSKTNQWMFKDLKKFQAEFDRTKMPLAVPISTREPKRTMNQSAATPLKRIVATESTNQKPRSTIRKQYDQISKICKWWYCKITPPGYKWKPKSRTVNVEPNLVEIILFIVNSGCSKHMTGNLKLLSNFMEQFLGTVKFGNDQIAPILGYGDLVQGNVTIKRVYYVEGLNHNLFSVGQLCDADLEVAFQKSTCYIRDLKGNDLLTGSCGTDMYSITLQDTSTPNLICLMAKATSSQAWLWHRRLSHLNFDTINLLSKGTEFLNKNLHAYFAQEGIEHQTSTARTPEQNGIVERRNRTLVENRSLIIPRHEKTPYYIINGRKPSVKFFHIFGSLCYIVKDGENLDKMKEKGDACIFVGYSTQSRTYRMALDHVSSDPSPQCPTTTLKQDSLSLGPQSQKNIPHSSKTVTMSNELDLLFSLMFDELLNGSTLVVSKSSAVTTANVPNQRQQQHITLSTSTTVAADTPPLNIQTTLETRQEPTQAPTVTGTKNINQAETPKENAQVDEDEFINIFSTPEELHQHGMTSCDSVGNPMATKTLDADLSGNPVDQTKYHSMVGALMYLTASRPDIIHATCYCARYQARPTKKKIKEVKWIFKYLKSTINMGLWYPKDTSFELTAFSDSDHAGCLDTHKSTYGGIQFLGGDKLVNWSSKKQDCTLMSSV
ncbi:retrovirus-related pol polyprotein from transposon TNT 1-94 [Tanacetum coccineum]